MKPRKIVHGSTTYLSIYSDAFEELIKFAGHKNGIYMVDRAPICTLMPISLERYRAAGGLTVQEYMDGKVKDKTKSKSLYSSEELDEYLNKIRDHFGIEFENDTPVWKVAKMIHDKRRES
jgi:hypothetical protein